MIKALVTLGLVQALATTVFAETAGRLSDMSDVSECPGQKRAIVAHSHNHGVGEDKNLHGRGGFIKGYEGVHKLRPAKIIDVGIIRSKLETEPTDNRERPDRYDTARDSAGTIWCEKKNGQLVISGSATNVCGEVVRDAQRGFIVESWPRSLTGDRIVATAHNFLYKVKHSDGRFGSVSYPGACYFYPRGNEPSEELLEEDSVDWWLPLKNERANEDQLRAKITYKALNTTNPWGDGFFEQGNDSAAAIINKHFSENGFTCSPIADLRKLGILERTISKPDRIKLYAFDAQMWRISVDKESCRGEIAKPGYINEHMNNTMLDECHSMGQASGGGLHTTFYLGPEVFVEAVFAVRKSHLYPNAQAKDPPIGLPYNPRKNENFNANLAVLIEGNFYKAIRAIVDKK